LEPKAVIFLSCVALVVAQFWMGLRMWSHGHRWMGGLAVAISLLLVLGAAWLTAYTIGVVLIPVFLVMATVALLRVLDKDFFGHQTHQ
jgi:hypothetical protein